MGTVLAISPPPDFSKVFFFCQFVMPHILPGANCTQAVLGCHSYCETSHGDPDGSLSGVTQHWPDLYILIPLWNLRSLGPAVQVIDGRL